MASSLLNELLRNLHKFAYRSFSSLHFPASALSYEHFTQDWKPNFSNYPILHSILVNPMTMRCCHFPLNQATRCLLRRPDLRYLIWQCKWFNNLFPADSIWIAPANKLDFLTTQFYVALRNPNSYTKLYLLVCVAYLAVFVKSFGMFEDEIMLYLLQSTAEGRPFEFISLTCTVSAVLGLYIYYLYK